MKAFPVALAVAAMCAPTFEIRRSYGEDFRGKYEGPCTGQGGRRRKNQQERKEDHERRVKARKVQKRARRESRT